MECVTYHRCHRLDIWTVKDIVVGERLNARRLAHGYRSKFVGMAETTLAQGSAATRYRYWYLIPRHSAVDVDEAAVPILVAIGTESLRQLSARLAWSCVFQSLNILSRYVPDYVPIKGLRSTIFICELEIYGRTHPANGIAKSSPSWKPAFALTRMRRLG